MATDKNVTVQRVSSHVQTRQRVAVKVRRHRSDGAQVYRRVFEAYTTCKINDRRHLARSNSSVSSASSELCLSLKSVQSDESLSGISKASQPCQQKDNQSTVDKDDKETQTICTGPCNCKCVEDQRLKNEC